MPRLHWRASIADRRLLGVWVLGAVLAASPALAVVSRVAALGDQAPGGGRFVGPALASDPAVAGSGWVAFRSGIVRELDTAAPATLMEGIVLLNPSSGVEEVVATTGGTFGDRTIAGFLGFPGVGPTGDVAFVAQLDGERCPGTDTIPAALLVLRRPCGSLACAEAVVAPCAASPLGGQLDLATPIDRDRYPASSADVLERTPGLGPGSTVVFASATVPTTDPAIPGAGVFRWRPNAGLAALVTTDRLLTASTPLGDRVYRFDALGPPATNAAGAVAFRAVFGGGAPGQGVFVRDDDGTLRALVEDGHIVDLCDPLEPLSCDESNTDPRRMQAIASFGDQVRIDDSGRVAATAGPFVDPGTLPPADEEGGESSADGIFVYQNAELVPVLLPWRQLCVVAGSGPCVPAGARVTGISLDGSEVGARAAAPGMSPTGTLAMLARLDGGASERVLTSAPPYDDLRTCSVTGNALGTPTGVYRLAATAVGIDADGALTFGARLSESDASEVLVQWSDSDCGSVRAAVPVGHSIGGLSLGGDPFFPPQLGDGGDVVFRAFVSGGTGSLGLFRSRAGALSAVARTRGDLPGEANPRALQHLPADAEINASNAVVFLAVVDGDREVFEADADDVLTRRLHPDQLQPSNSDERLVRLLRSPVGDDAGNITFEARADLEGRSVRGFFLGQVDGSFELLVSENAASGLMRDGDVLRFLRFFRPGTVATSEGVVVAFRAGVAGVGDSSPALSGLFRTTWTPADGPTTHPLLAEGDELEAPDPADDTATETLAVDALTGVPGVGAAGDVAFSARLRPLADPDAAAEPMVLRWDAALEATTVVARPGLLGPDVGEPGPDDDARLRATGPPSVNRRGEIAFLGSFDGCSARNGYLLGDTAGLRHLLFRSDGADPIAQLGRNVVVNDARRLAFKAVLDRGGDAPAILLADARAETDAVPSCAGATTTTTLAPRGTTTTTMRVAEVCNNGVDDDANGLVDCRDPLCEGVGCQLGCPLALTGASLACRLEVLQSRLSDLRTDLFTRPRHARVLGRVLRALKKAENALGRAVAACEAGRTRKARRRIRKAASRAAAAARKVGALESDGLDVDRDTSAVVASTRADLLALRSAPECSQIASASAR